MIEIDNKELKEILLDLLIRFDYFCKKNNLKYFLHAGTLLGAIRHKGFIPWDDDIDLAMPRDDYERLKNLDNGADYSFLYFNDNDFPFAYGKINDNNTLIVEDNISDDMEREVFLDIFPIDVTPDEYNAALKFLKKCSFITWLIFMSREKTFQKAKKGVIPNIAKSILFPFSHVVGTKFWINKLCSFSTKYRNIESRYVAIAVDPNYIKVYEKKWFDETVELEFEGRKFKAPVGWDELLKCLYKNYMELPPVEKRVTHHTL